MFYYPKDYDVLVIGAGHGGIEAALAAARVGASVGMVTQNLDTIGQIRKTNREYLFVFIIQKVIRNLENVAVGNQPNLPLQKRDCSHLLC